MQAIRFLLSIALAIFVSGNVSAVAQSWIFVFPDIIHSSPTATKVGLGVTGPVNILDINGGCVIGNAYAGSATAPANGLLVEGTAGFGTSSPLAALHVEGGILATGTTGAVPTSGAGTRLMWVPSLSAFRAGSVNGTEWDALSVGINSAAFGANTIASNAYSTAFGRDTRAVGRISTALGDATLASGEHSIAWGRLTEASGTSSMAGGLQSTASGLYSTSVGFNNNASGDYSTAIGSNLIASGLFATALGSRNHATNEHAVSIGYGCVASGQRSFATGNGAVASGYTATATGIGTVSDGNASFVAGEFSTASGDNSLALGENVEASGVNSVVIGHGCSIGNRLVNSIDNSFMVGFLSKAPTLFVGPASSCDVNRACGNVGICTTTPTHTLHVAGTARFNGQTQIGNQTITSGPNTDYLLSVDGKIVARELVITNSNWADFVFADDYELMPLDVLEAAIHELGHLPGIPSANEVAANGVPVGEMQVSLLQKIEELTLYMIDLKKENAAMKAALLELQQAR